MFDTIVNRNEYFSNHYLDALLQNDLAGLRERWRLADDRSERNARASLQRAGAAFFTARAEAVEANNDQSVAATQRLNDVVLDALGFVATRQEFHAQRGEHETVVVDVAHLADSGSGVLLVALDAGLAADLDDVFDVQSAGALLVPMRIDDKLEHSVADAASYLFACDDPPRYVLLLAGGLVVLADREKWAEGRFLSVDLATALERRDIKAKGELETIAALFSADALVPTDGQSVFDQLIDKSHKHAVGVSKDLRDGIRLSIELLANEVIAQRLARNLNVYSGGVDPKELTRQCLRFLYRLLVLLYAEARPELGVLPAGDDDYTNGYSLDRLRDFALLDLHTDKARNGTHIHESLKLLFRLVNDGYNHDATQGQMIFDAADATGEKDRLVFVPLRSGLFADDATPLLDRVPLSNAVLQQVLEHLMLSKAKGRTERGFISYAQLGINQLGAVYEGLMAYSGFFATEDLYEVARHGDPSDGVWLLPVSRGDELDDDLFVKRDEPDTGIVSRVLHKRGSFVFRLSGRDRQRSASYYTPEVLTKCVVKHALAELLDQDDATTRASEILQFEICEPALGSGAFLNEAISQLAHEYLRRRQNELNDVLNPDVYNDELQKVKAHLALNQCYGVDLNATAVELAEVSLWLNCMHPGLEAPWFGARLRRGNSLIGCRRATYGVGSLKVRPWIDTAPLDRPLSEGQLPDGSIHHFLLPGHGWAAVADAKEAKELRADRCKGLRDWRSMMMKSPTKGDATRLEALSRRVEEVWAWATERLAAVDRGTRRPLSLYGYETPQDPVRLTHTDAETTLHDPDSALGRLRLVMDAWVGLWFWPTGTDVSLPTWQQWLDGLEAMLGVSDAIGPSGQLDIFEDLPVLLERERQRALDLQLRATSKILEERPWLALAVELARREGAWHWELELAPVFSRGGFDLQVGNPPWVRLDWKDDVVLAEREPWFGITEKAPEAERKRRRRVALSDNLTEQIYLDEAASAAGLTNVLGSQVLRPVLKGVRTNLYMLFIDTVWRNTNGRGVASLLHPEGHFLDPDAGFFRRATYRRLRRHFQFINEALLFEDIGHPVQYGIHVYSSDGSPTFISMSNLQVPSTADGSIAHDGSGEVPGIKTSGGEWDLRPHAARVVTVTEEVLASWARLFDEPGTPAAEARLLRPVTVEDLGALKVLANQPIRLADHQYYWAQGWNETTAKVDGYIEWRTEVPASWDEVILQGPHFTVATPFAKQPNENCKSKGDYSDWNLETLPERVIPRTNYQRACDPGTYTAALDHWGGDAYTNYWRVVWRRMTQPGGVRSLRATLLHPGPAFIFTAWSISMPDLPANATFAGLCSSLPFDYLVKVSGRTDITFDFMGRFPLPRQHKAYPALIFRLLRLNCLTADYAPLWELLYQPAWRDDRWTDVTTSTRLALDEVGAKWTMATPLRTDYDRRKALVEIDALAALVLDLSAEQLCAMYRAQFAVLRKYEYHMRFDAQGRQIAKDHQAAGFHQEKGDWDLVNQWLDDPEAVTLPVRYRAPFVKPDREKEMSIAYDEFSRRLGLNK